MKKSGRYEIPGSNAVVVRAVVIFYPSSLGLGLILVVVSRFVIVIHVLLNVVSKAR